MRTIVAAAVTLAGCGEIDDVRDVIEGLTHPLATEAILLGLEDPGFEVDLAGTPFDGGAGVVVYLADTDDVDSLADSPVEGATVTLKAPCMGEAWLGEVEPGTYQATGVDGVAYVPTETYVLSVDLGGELHRAQVVAPRAADLDVPTSHPARTALLLDLTEYDYEAALVAVVEVSAQAVTWSNEPSSIDEVYDTTHDGGAVKRVEIPAKAFPRDGWYALGVAGLRGAEADDLTGMNTGLSTVLAGQMRVWFLQAG